MIKVETSKFDFQQFDMKTCSSANGGYIQIIDETTKTGLRTIKIPRHVTHSFQKAKGNVSKYLNPIPVCVGFYDGFAFAIEDMRENASFDTEGKIIKWERKQTPNTIDNILKLIDIIDNDPDTWYIDGEFVYKENTSQPIIDLTSDGKFKCIPMYVINLSFSTLLMTKKGLDPMSLGERVSIGYFATNGTYSISSPEWANYSRIVHASISQDQKPKHVEYPFDTINEKYGVNLLFALRSAGIISEYFGYDAIEPLNLPDIMVDLNTVNLPNIPQSMKSTYDIGLQLTHAMAWLLGLSTKISKVDQYYEMSNLVRSLMANGTFYKESVKIENIFVEGVDVADIQLIDYKDAMGIDLTLEDFANDSKINVDTLPEFA